MAEPDPRWADAVAAAALLAVDPSGLAGAHVRAWPGPVRRLWLETLRGFLGADTPIRPIPLNVGEDRLLGGLDLPATLRAGKPMLSRGLLAEADGGVVLISMAERIAPSTAAQIALAQEQGAVRLERDGLTGRTETAFGIIAMDEGEEDERAPAALTERLAFRLSLDGIRASAAPDGLIDPADIAAARHLVDHVTVPEAIITSLCQVAAALGAGSVRAEILAMKAARAAAALAGRGAVGEEEAELAVRLVLAPRATQMPAPPDPEQPDEAEQQAPDQEQPPEQPPEPTQAPDQDPEPPADSASNAAADQDRLIDAAQAALPPDLLARLLAGGGGLAGGRGRAKGQKPPSGGRRGRPAGLKRGAPAGRDKLNVVETLRAAAPYQRLRDGEGVQVRPEDFRLTRYKQPALTSTLFVVDASGSSALNRLAEAKGAVELLLADCYVRRDEVALIAFRGQGAEVLLPPTRSTARAKRSLTGLPGGGGTPLAAGLEAALSLSLQVVRDGRRPLIVLLTDGGANIARDGSPGRAAAREDALRLARQIRVADLAALVVDTSPRRQHGRALDLAEAMAAEYVALPQADAASLSIAVKGRSQVLREAG